MTAPLLVVVTGPPAADKTSIARELDAMVELPLFRGSVEELLASVVRTELGAATPAGAGAR